PTLHCTGEAYLRGTRKNGKSRPKTVKQNPYARPEISQDPALREGFVLRSNTTPLTSYEPLVGFVRMDNMNRTYTPELTPEVLERLRDYAELFRDDFRYKTQHSWSGVYLRGLLQDGERKSIEPLVARVPRPAELLDIRDPEQAMQQFVNQSPWDEQPV